VAGEVVHTAEIRQFLCDLATGPLAGQLVVLTAPSLPNLGDACQDSSGSAGTVVYVEPASGPDGAPLNPARPAPAEANARTQCPGSLDHAFCWA
jgi:hypothetical protein